MAHGRHQILSSFWTQHMQRAARAELALRINKAHKDAEREQSLKWHTLRVRTPCSYGYDIKKQAAVDLYCEELAANSQRVAKQDSGCWLHVRVLDVAGPQKGE